MRAMRSAWRRTWFAIRPTCSGGSSVLWLSIVAARPRMVVSGWRRS